MPILLTKIQYIVSGAVVEWFCNRSPLTSLGRFTFHALKLQDKNVRTCTVRNIGNAVRYAEKTSSFTKGERHRGERVNSIERIQQGINEIGDDTREAHDVFKHKQPVGGSYQDSPRAPDLYITAVYRPVASFECWISARPQNAHSTDGVPKQPYIRACRIDLQPTACRCLALRCHAAYHINI